MKKIILSISVFSFALSALAQKPREEINANILLSGSNYVAYQGPQSALTPVPKGYVPFYLSHYGRHGSRYLIGTNDYERPYKVLDKADRLGKLTALGKDVKKRVKAIWDEAKGRDGELTKLGALQHKQIARRMLQNFPEIFEGETNVDAKSTVVIRCILSMENALQQMLVMNPKLVITHDASYHDMYYMNQPDKYLDSLKKVGTSDAAYVEFTKRHSHPERLMSTLFNDDTYWKDSINSVDLYRKLFSLASNQQSTDLRDKVSLYDLFTKEEVYDLWQCNNAFWYIAYGPSKLSGGVQPYSQRNLLRKIISEADSCIALKHPGATLRYGHDTMVMPLTCLLGLDGLDIQIDDLEQLDDANWRNYDIFPMGCNLQFVFYRNKKDDKDIIFKVLRNENEATLPLSTDMAPYYHWSDFKKYYLDKLDAYDKK